MKDTDNTEGALRGSSGERTSARKVRPIPSRSSTEGRQTGQRAYTAFAEYLARAESLGIKNMQTMTAVDISDHRPENLRLIDAVLDERFHATLEKRGEIESASIATGTYLGEVFVRNLAGRWRYPSWLHAIRASISRDRCRAERYCYVLLGDEKVYVFQAARESINKTGAIFSLYEFYQRYARQPHISPDGGPHSFRDVLLPGGPPSGHTPRDPQG